MFRKQLLENMMSGTGMEIDETNTFFGGWNQFKTVYKDAMSQAEAPLIGDPTFLFSIGLFVSFLDLLIPNNRTSATKSIQSKWLIYRQGARCH